MWISSSKTARVTRLYLDNEHKRNDMLRPTLLSLVLLLSCLNSNHAQTIPTVEWDSHSLIIGGHRVVPVMGEVHYSRIPAEEWSREVKKMKYTGSDGE